jgi:hypothetical protein
MGNLAMSRKYQLTKYKSCSPNRRKADAKPAEAEPAVADPSPPLTPPAPLANEPRPSYLWLA